MLVVASFDVIRSKTLGHGEEVVLLLFLDVCLGNDCATRTGGSVGRAGVIVEGSSVQSVSEFAGRGAAR